MRKRGKKQDREREREREKKSVKQGVWTPDAKQSLRMEAAPFFCVGWE